MFIHYFSKYKQVRGMTLIELVMVIMIIAILAGIAIPIYYNLQKKAELAVAEGIAGSLRSSIMTHAAGHKGKFPTCEELKDAVMKSDDFDLDCVNDSAVSTETQEKDVL